MWSRLVGALKTACARWNLSSASAYLPACWSWYARREELARGRAIGVAHRCCARDGLRRGEAGGESETATVASLARCEERIRMGDQ